MPFFISRYLIPYVISIAIFGTLWLLTIFVFDGIIPALVFLLLLSVAIFQIPYCLYCDYKKTKNFVMGFVAANKDMLDVTACVETYAQLMGISPDIAAKLLEKAKTKFFKT